MFDKFKKYKEEIGLLLSFVGTFAAVISCIIIVLQFFDIKIGMINNLINGFSTSFILLVVLFFFILLILVLLRFKRFSIVNLKYGFESFIMAILAILIAFIIIQFLGIVLISVILIVVTILCLISLSIWCIPKYDLKLQDNRTFLILVMVSLLVSGMIAGYTVNDRNSEYNFNEDLNIPIAPTNKYSDSGNDSLVSNDYKIVVDYNGPYKLFFETINTEGILSNKIPDEINVHNTPFINVRANKSDESNEKLTILIMDGETIVCSNSTTEPNGKLIINFKKDNNYFL